MKKLFKERNLYFLIKQPYPQNLYLKGFPIWANKKLVPEFEKPLEKTINHLKKKLLKKKVSGSRKKTGRCPLLDKNQYPLFSIGQAENHVESPRTLYRKVSYYYKNLVEKKKYHILYGISNQKELIKDLPSMATSSFTLLEKKVDVVFFKTGMFQSLREVQKEIKDGRLFWNGEKVLSFSIRGYPGDFFQLKKEKLDRDALELIPMGEKKPHPQRLLFTPFFLQSKKIRLTLKKILVFNYLSDYRKKKKLPILMKNFMRKRFVPIKKKEALPLKKYSMKKKLFDKKKEGRPH